MVYEKNLPYTLLPMLFTISSAIVAAAEEGEPWRTDTISDVPFCLESPSFLAKDGRLSENRRWKNFAEVDLSWLTQTAFFSGDPDEKWYTCLVGREKSSKSVGFAVHS